MIHSIYCVVDVKPAEEQVSFTWGERATYIEPYFLKGNDFRRFLQNGKEVRAALVELNNLCDQFADLTKAEVKEACFKLADAGYKLYLCMLSPAPTEMRDWLTVLRQSAETHTLEMVLKGPRPVPWNVVYDSLPVKAHFLDDNNTDKWAPFWSVRYNLSCGRKVEPWKLLPLRGDPVLFVVDHKTAKRLEPVDRQRLRQFARARGIRIIHTAEKLRKLQQQKPATIMYWLCHGTPTALSLGQTDIDFAQMSYLLELGREQSRRAGGLAILNACHTGEESDESDSFLDTFHKHGFHGLVATEERTFDAFANRFGLDFLEAVLDQGQPVGAALHDLRQRQSNLPLGLLYTTYCPPDLCLATSPAALPAPTPRPVPSAVLTVGAALQGPSPLAVPPYPPAPPPLPDHPYRSLNYYDREHRALFVGRDADVERFALLLDDARTKVLVLHGESGVGKSSFLRAGLIPFLEEESRGYRFLRSHTGEGKEAVLLIRCTNDPFRQLAQALHDFCKQPLTFRRPTGTDAEVPLPRLLAQALGQTTVPSTVPSPAQLRQALLDDPRLLGQLLQEIARPLPFTPLLVIDQCEEVFTLARGPADQNLRAQALDTLRRLAGAPGDFKVILSLRTEYHGRLIDPLRRNPRDLLGVREYLLTDCDENALVEVIERPTSEKPIPHATEIPFQKYRFRYAPGLARQLAQHVLHQSLNSQDSALPLVQIICTELYEIAEQRKNAGAAEVTLTRDDLTYIGGVQGGMRQYVEKLMARLMPSAKDREAFKKTLISLSRQQPDGALTTEILRAKDLAAAWKGETPFDRILNLVATPETRLLRRKALRIAGADETEYVSLGHDAIARVAADWQAELRQQEAQAAERRKAEAALQAEKDRRAALEKHEKERQAKITRLRRDRALWVGAAAVMAILLVVIFVLGWNVAEAYKELKEGNCKLEKAKAELDKKLGETQNLLVESLLANIGLQTGPLNLQEVAVLWKMAALKREYVSGRVGLFEKALQNDETALKLLRRVDYAVHAAVGFDLKQRIKLLDLVRGKFLDEKQSLDARVACVLIQMELGEKPQAAPEAAALLVQKTLKADPVTEPILNAALDRLANHLTGPAGDTVILQNFDVLVTGLQATDLKDYLKRDTIARLMKTLAGRLPKNQAADERTTALLKLLKKETDNYTGRILAQAFAQASDRTKNGAAPVLKGLLDQLQPGKVGVNLAQAVDELSHRVPSATPAQLTAVLELLSQEKTPLVRDNLAQALIALAKKLPTAQNLKEPIDTVQKLVLKESDSQTIALLAGALGVLTGKAAQSQQELQAQIRAIMLRFPEEANFTKKDNLAKSLQILAGFLPEGQATEIQVTGLRVLIEREQDTITRGYMAQALKVLAGKLPPEKAPDSTIETIDLMRREMLRVEDRATGAKFAQAVAALVGRLPAKMRKTRLNAWLDQLRVANKPLQRQVLAEAMSTLANGFMQPDVNLQQIVSLRTRITAEKDYDTRKSLAACLLTLVLKLPDGKGAIGQVDTLREMVSGEKDGAIKGLLAQALGTLASKLPHEKLPQALADFRRLLEKEQDDNLLGKKQEENLRLVFAQNLKIIASQLPKGNSEQIRELLDLLKRQKAINMKVPLAVAAATVTSKLPQQSFTKDTVVRMQKEQSQILLDLLPGPDVPSADKHDLHLVVGLFLDTCSADVLVNALRMPTCVGEARGLLLQKLQRKFEQQHPEPFFDLWDFVAWAKEQHPELNLDIELESPYEQPIHPVVQP